MIKRMNELVQSYTDDKEFMGSVLVAKNQDIVLNNGYGFANIEWNIPNIPTTKYRLGSLTKQFTAAAILLLEERGLLNTEDFITQHMPNCNGRNRHRTLFSLGRHGPFNTCDRIPMWV